jgi:hypothetical protein
MKNILIGLFVFAAIGLTAFVNDRSKTLDANYDDASSTFYSYSVSDTITNTEIDTITIPVSLLSPWSGYWSIVATNLSGTTYILPTVLQAASSTDYTSIATLDTLNVNGLVQSYEDAIIGGTKYRLVLTGVGTQSTRYTAYFVAKNP